MNPSRSRQYPRIPRHTRRRQRRPCGSAACKRRQFPRAAQRRRADAARRGRNIRPGRLDQGVDELRARRAGPSLAAPQPEIAVPPKRPADRRQILGVLRQSRGRPFARGEAHPPGRAMRDHVHGLEAAPTAKRLGHLAGRGALGIEHDRFDVRAQAFEKSRQIRDRGINEQNFGSTAHVPHSNGRMLIQENLRFGAGHQRRSAVLEAPTGRDPGAMTATAVALRKSPRRWFAAWFGLRNDFGVGDRCTHGTHPLTAIGRKGPRRHCFNPSGTLPPPCRPASRQGWLPKESIRRVSAWPRRLL